MSETEKHFFCAIDIQLIHSVQIRKIWFQIQIQHTKMAIRLIFDNFSVGGFFFQFHHYFGFLDF